MAFFISSHDTKNINICRFESIIMPVSSTPCIPKLQKNIIDIYNITAIAWQFPRATLHVADPVEAPSCSNPAKLALTLESYPHESRIFVARIDVALWYRAKYS